MEKLWQVLGPSLSEPITKDAEELLEVFCAAYHLDEESFGRAIKASRFVLREAAQRDVPSVAFAEDLGRLCPEDRLVSELLLAGYEPAKARLRHEIVKAAVADHGKLLVGVKWRLDAVQASEQGARLQMPVALFTLHYLEGREMGRFTVQILPDMVNELKTACENVLGDPRRGERS
jgi:hypothetical protein